MSHQTPHEGASDSWRSSTKNIQSDGPRSAYHSKNNVLQAPDSYDSYAILLNPDAGGWHLELAPLSDLTFISFHSVVTV